MSKCPECQHPWEKHGMPPGCRMQVAQENIGTRFCSCTRIKPDDESLIEAAFQAKEKGYDNVCLECLKGFDGQVCPRGCHESREHAEDLIEFETGEDPKDRVKRIWVDSRGGELPLVTADLLWLMKQVEASSYIPTEKARYCNQAGPMGGGCKDSWHVGGNYGSHVCKNPNHHETNDT